MGQNIMTAAIDCGCGNSYPTWMVAPEVLGHQLLTAAKRYARFLKDEKLAQSHSEALERVARATGIESWFRFQRLAQGLVDDYNTEVHWPRPKVDEGRVANFISAFPLLTTTKPSCPPTPHEKAGLTEIASKLAKQCARQDDVLLDLIARMNGADSWSLLLTRAPQDGKGTLYRFQATDEGKFFGGRFVCSDTCTALVEQQDRLFQGYWSRNESEQVEFKQLLDEVLAKRPDFLEGLLAKAEILRNDPYATREGVILFSVQIVAL